ncbi:MAG TPA: hypothetical protein VGN63_18710 [Flavisolibacter sp.]|nr:hypothetical protein [Flavisolibacter sp.]
MALKRIVHSRQQSLRSQLKEATVLYNAFLTCTRTTCYLLNV